MRRIGLYGGAFDPITKNHMLVANTSLKHLNQVWFLPCYKSETKIITESHHRLNMLNIAIKHNDNNQIKLCSLEIENKFLKTWDTINLIKAKYHDSILYFITGIDNANKMYDQKRLPHIVISRKPYEVTNDWYLRDPHIFMQIEDDGGSSSHVRKNIKAHRSSDLICRDIMDYIVANQLYI